MSGLRERYGEAFWRTHHEAWCRSELNQRQYCESQGIPLKAFGNWRAKLKAEPQLPERKLLYRRRGLSHTLSHGLSHGLSHMTYGSIASGPSVPPPRDGRRRTFSEADKRQMVDEAVRPGASLSAVARHNGIAARVLFRWKQELTPPAAPMWAADGEHADCPACDGEGTGRVFGGLAALILNLVVSAEHLQ